jgi:hypothetical protein
MREVAMKVDWEGGEEEALRWGLYSRLVPLEIEDDWKQMEQAFWAYENVRERVFKALEPYHGGPDE